MLRRVCAVLPIAAILVGCGGGTPAPDSTPRFDMTGRVTTEGGSLPYASVVLMKTPLGGVTDADGQFVIPGIRRGSYELAVLAIGFRSQEMDLEIPGDGEGEMNLLMYVDPGSEIVPTDSLTAVRITYEVR